MSKNLPAIRYHGNVKAGFRHTKRGLHELFRTEELQKHMGVPILKRTIEVSEYTYITVHIQLEQTFVHIYSNPPELPEVILPPPEKEKEPPSGCPSAFLIRFIPARTANDAILAADAQDGYLIGYDHSSDTWRIMHIINDGVVLDQPAAANLGWYHNHNSADGIFSHCDIVTWHGQGAPDFHPAWLPGHWSSGFTILDYAARTLLQKRVYFQGREFTTPEYVVGACILHMPDNQGVKRDYMYLHCADVSRNPLSGVPEDMRLDADTFYRLPMSALLAESEDWQLLESITPEAYEGYLTFNAYPHMYHPRTTAYVDKNGFSYVTREYSGDLGESHDLGEQTGADPNHGFTAFIKFNMRDGSWKILSSTETNCPTFAVDFSGTVTVPPLGPGPYDDLPFFGGMSISNPNGPWVFYVWPGTEDLYTLSLEHNYSGSSGDSKEKDGSSTTYRGAGQLSGKSYLQLRKNDKLVDTLDVVSINSASSYTFNNGESIDEGSGTLSADMLSIYEWHPEIPDSMHTFATQMLGGTDVLINIDWDDGSNTVQIYSEVASAPVGCRWTAAFDYGDTKQKATWADYRYPSGASLAYTPMYQGRTSMGFLSQDWLPCVYALTSGIPFNLPTSPSGGNSAITNIGFQLGIEDNRYLTTPKKDGRRIYGGASSFIVPAYKSTVNDSNFWLASSYAVHKAVKGVKPYLWLRKKHYAASSYVWSASTSRMMGGADINVNDDDPGTSWPSPYDSPLAEKKSFFLWTKPVGSFYNLEDDPGKEDIPHWNDEEWVLESNFLTAEMLNAMTKETGNAFINIGII